MGLHFQFRGVAAALALSAALLARSIPAGAMCCPFPCRGCTIASQGQINLVVMDHAHGRVRLIPNIRFTGNASDLALVVPTPSQPSFAPAPAEIWGEITRLTQPAQSTGRSGNAFGCGSSALYAPNSGGSEGGVNIVSRDTVGGFLATVLTSDDPGALVRWLSDHAFAVDTAQAAAFEPYTRRGWFFTAMKLDPSNPASHVPPGGWNASVAPVEISFSSLQLEVPLPLIAINRDPYMTVTFYVVDDHRVTLPGYATRYVNHLSDREMTAIQSQYPRIAGYLGSGSFLTRMDRTYGPAEPMSESAMLQRAGSDAEVHWKTSDGARDATADFLALIGIPWTWRWWSRGRRARA